MATGCGDCECPFRAPLPPDFINRFTLPSDQGTDNTGFNRRDFGGCFAAEEPAYAGEVAEPKGLRVTRE